MVGVPAGRVLPGLTGRMYAKFALVIARTALLSGTFQMGARPPHKPTHKSNGLRAPVPPSQRNASYRRPSNAGLRRVLERGYARLSGRIGG